jgi:hypothetical protein
MYLRTLCVLAPGARDRPGELPQALSLRLAAAAPPRIKRHVTRQRGPGVALSACIAIIICCLVCCTSPLEPGNRAARACSCSSCSPPQHAVSCPTTSRPPSLCLLAPSALPPAPATFAAPSTTLCDAWATNTAAANASCWSVRPSPALKLPTNTLALLATLYSSTTNLRHLTC